MSKGKKITTIITVAVITLVIGITRVNAQVASTTTACLDLQRNLTLGSKGDDVGKLQTFLISKGFKIGAIVDRGAKPGFFGPETRDAAILYQKSVDIPAAGFVGPLTRGKIKGACDVAVSTPTAVSTAETLISISKASNSHILIDNGSKLPTKLFFTYKFTLTNNHDFDIFVGNKAGNTVSLVTVQGQSIASVSMVSAEPENISGDNTLSYIIPPKTSRAFVVNGRADNTKGRTGTQVFNIISIPYSTSPSLSPPINFPIKNLPGLRMSVLLGGNGTTTPLVTPIVTPSATPRPTTVNPFVPRITTTPTQTVIVTPSQTVTPSPTYSPVYSPTYTTTSIPSPTYTTTQTPTPTSSPTQTQTSTPTATVTPTPTQTSSPSPTYNSSPTATPSVVSLITPPETQKASVWQAIKNVFGI